MTADPMDVLRLPVVPVAPRPAFAGDLRARLAGWLGGDDDPAPALVAADAAIMPYLSVRGAAAAIRWYAEVLGAVALGDPIVEADGRIGHLELRIGNAKFALADEYPELDIVSPLTRGGPSVSLQVVVADCDATFAAAVAGGATIRREPSDEFYGARVANFRDPWGHEWFLHQPIEQVTREEMAERLDGTDFGFASLDDLDVPGIDLGRRAGTTAAPAPEQRRAADRVGDLGYFTIDVPDPDVTAEFFAALFGWHVVPGDLEEGRHIATVAPPGGIHGGRPPGATLYFRVGDLEEAAARVRELGGEVLAVTDDASGANASCLDPQGVPFELWRPAPGH
jgi:uncharacterized glyoxalase superfamily protein PhnB